jgi:hypothetical protein
LRLFTFTLELSQCHRVVLIHLKIKRVNHVSHHISLKENNPLFLAYGLGRFLGLLDFLDLLRPGRLWSLLGCTDRGLVLCRKRTILFHQQLDDLAD